MLHCNHCSILVLSDVAAQCCNLCVLCGTAILVLSDIVIQSSNLCVLCGTAILVLSGVVLAFLAFIGSYALQAAQAVGESAEAIIEYDKKMAEQQPKQEARGNKKDEAVYDDTGSGAVSDDKIMKEIAERKKRGKGSFQVGADGKKFAPWLVRAGRAASTHARCLP